MTKNFKQITRIFNDFLTGSQHPFVWICFIVSAPVFYESSKCEVSWLSSVSRTIMCLQVQPRLQIYRWYNHFLSPRWTLGAVHWYCVWRYIFLYWWNDKYSKQNFSNGLNNYDGSFSSNSLSTIDYKWTPCTRLFKTDRNQLFIYVRWQL